MVPEGWINLRLGSIAELQRGFDLPSNQRLDGSIPVVSSGGITGYHSEAKSKAPGVVTGRYGSIGDVFYLEEDYWPLNTSLWVKDFHGNHEKFIYYLLSNFDFKKFSGKTGVPGVNRNDLHAVKVNLPSLSEQKKIAQILSTWDKAITTTEQLLVNSQRQKKTLMQQLLTGKKRLLDKNGERFSEEWRVGYLNDLAKINKGKALSSKDLIVGDYPVVAGGKTSPYNHSQFTHENVITVSASGAYAGYVDYHPYKLWASDCSVVSNKNGFDIGFIYQLMKSLQIKIYSLQSGGAQPHIYPKDLEVIRVPILELKEQQKIASVLSVADQEIIALKQRLDVLKQEKKALMQQLLSGKRRVKIDYKEIA